jgi:hypothetical protein
VQSTQNTLRTHSYFTLRRIHSYLGTTARRSLAALSPSRFPLHHRRRVLLETFQMDSAAGVTHCVCVFTAREHLAKSMPVRLGHLVGLPRCASRTTLHREERNKREENARDLVGATSIIAHAIEYRCCTCTTTPFLRSCGDHNQANHGDVPECSVLEPDEQERHANTSAVTAGRKTHATT